MSIGEEKQVSRVGGGICGCILDSSAKEFPALLNYAGTDLVEWRLDCFNRRFEKEPPELFFEAMSNASRHPVVATNRPRREMGTFDGPEDARLRILEQAAIAGAEWVDIELDAAEGSVAGFHELGVKVLVSSHHPEGTPSLKQLRALLEKMAGTGAQALKIAAYARAVEDNLRVLELVTIARKEFGTDLIAFCMGPAGKLSRIACLLLGSPWTYARLPGQPAAAPGQLSDDEVRTLLEVLEHE